MANRFRKAPSSFEVEPLVSTDDDGSDGGWRSPTPSGWSWWHSMSLLKGSVALVALATWYALALRDPFATPFCDARGRCHETPDVASPRTVYSAWNKEQYRLWWSYYDALQERVDAYAQKRQALYEERQGGDATTTTASTTRPLLLLGDSITESWAGTGLGVPKIRSEGIPEVLEEELSASHNLDPLVLAMAGDQTQHLLYRLEHGHLKAAQLKKDGKKSIYDPSAVFVVMIGTNNLGSGELPGPTAKGVLAVAEFILKETADAGCRVLLFRILPRGDGSKVLPSLCPPRCQDDGAPYESFAPAIDEANRAIEAGIQSLGEQYSAHERLAFVECGTEFVNPTYQKGKDNTNIHEVKKGLMPDLLHPNARGHGILARCIQDYLHRIDG